MAIHVDGGKVEGSFTITRGNEPTRSRHVEGTTCDEVADVLSLALALTYDHEALTAPPPPPPITEPPRPPEPVPPPRPPPPRPRQGPAWLWRVGAHGTLAATTTVPVGGEVFADLAHRAGPSFRLDVEARIARTEVGPASVGLFWLHATPSACPVHLRSGRIDVAPCAGVALGAFSLSTGDIPGERSVLRPSIAPRASLLGSLRLTDRIALDARASIEAPLVRGTYRFEDVFAYEVPIAIPSFGLGMTVALAPDRR